MGIVSFLERATLHRGTKPETFSSLGTWMSLGDVAAPLGDYFHRLCAMQVRSMKQAVSTPSPANSSTDRLPRQSLGVCLARTQHVPIYFVQMSNNNRLWAVGCGGSKRLGETLCLHVFTSPASFRSGSGQKSKTSLCQVSGLDYS